MFLPLFYAHKCLDLLSGSPCRTQNENVCYFARGQFNGVGYALERLQDRFVVFRTRSRSGVVCVCVHVSRGTGHCAVELFGGGCIELLARKAGIFVAEVGVALGVACNFPILRILECVCVYSLYGSSFCTGVERGVLGAFWYFVQRPFCAQKSCAGVLKAC